MTPTHPTARTALALLALLAAGPAAAQEPAPTREPADTFELAELVVTATRLPLPASAVPAAVTVLDGEELRSRGVHHVLDALREVPGLTVVQSGSFGATTSLFLRGGESDYVQVLVDGVAVNAPGGSLDLSTLTTDNIERVEVVRGPVSVLYGSDAVTGVVQIFTRRGRGPATIRAHGRAGSWGTVDAGAAVSGGGRTLGYSLSLGSFRSDGIHALNNDYRNDVLSGELRARPDDRTDARLSLRLSDHEYHYPTDSFGNVVDSNAFQHGRRLTASAEVGRRLTDALALTLLLGTNELDGGIDDRSDGPDDLAGFYGYISDSRVARRSADLRADVRLGAGSVLTAGAELERQDETSSDESLSEFGAFPGAFDAERENRGYYAQLVTRLGAATLTGGARIDDNDAFGTFATYRVGANVAILPGTRVRAAAGTAFREPTFFQNFASGFVVGNTALQPEESRSWEAGIEHETGDVALSATWFDQRFTNMIDYTGTPPTAGAPNYYNIAGALSRGLELAARLQPTPGLRIGGSYTLLDTEVTDTAFTGGPNAEFAAGAELLRRPRHSASADIALSIAAGRLHAGVHYTGERQDMDFSTFPAERVTLDAFTRVELGAEYPVRVGTATVAATLRAENLFDAGYEMVRGFDGRGRTLLLGARVELSP